MSHMFSKHCLPYRHNGKVEFRYNRPVSNGKPPITETILKSLEKFFFILFIFNNGNPPKTDKNSWSLEIR